VDPVPDPLLLTKSGSAGNRTRNSGLPHHILFETMPLNIYTNGTHQLKLVISVNDDTNVTRI
jgi:hypothetical protein